LVIPAIDRLAQSEEEEIKQLKKRLITTVPMGRMGSPDEVAKVVSFLESDESSFVTGIDLSIDGGMAQI
jgi:NAD(P)-dependent dehydrogenase (short-subunit alcohol dehydrogenase family)